MTRVKKGMRFRSVYADSNPLWEVKKSRGGNCWLCEIVNEQVSINGKIYDADYVGIQNVFAGEQILASARQDEAWQAAMNEHAQFYASLRRGQTVHYSNGFGEFVRCTVTTENGKTKLQPIALVGQWKPHDLPRRMPDGSLEMGYYGKMINAGELFEPNYSNIVENPKWKPNPQYPLTATAIACMPNLTLIPPRPTPEQEATAAFLQEKARIQERLALVETPADMKVFKSWLAAYPYR